MGKGSSPRPFEVSMEQFASNWDAIFKKGQSNVKYVQEKASVTDGANQGSAGQERGNDSSGDRPLSADNKPTQ